MSKRRPTRDPAPADDAALFRAAVAGAVPLRKGRSAGPVKRKPRPVPAKRLADERAVLEESLAMPPEDADLDSGEVTSYARPGVQHAVLKRLRRGTYRCDAELDLHGMTRERAHASLIGFLRESIADGARCVRIIHGKGLGSGNRGPVLRTSLGRWLRRDEVLAYASAPPAQGGSGATLVLLRKEE
jgi:DNA-nicking Smr family endonuclease